MIILPLFGLVEQGSLPEDMWHVRVHALVVMYGNAKTASSWKKKSVNLAR